MGASTAVRVPLLFLVTCWLLRCVATKAMSVLSIECVVEEVIVAGGGGGKQLQRWMTKRSIGMLRPGFIRRALHLQLARGNIEIIAASPHSQFRLRLTIVKNLRAIALQGRSHQI